MNTMQIARVAMVRGSATSREPSRIATVSGLPSAAVAVNVLHGDRGVVDQYAGGERQTAEGHQVDGVAGKVQADDAGKHRARNRGDHHDGVAPAPQEQQDHQRYQQRGEHRFGGDVLDRGAHEHRLVEIQADLACPPAPPVPDLGQDLAGGLHHRQAGGIGMLQDGQVGGAPAVHVHDVVLNGEAVVHPGHVAQQHRHAATTFSGMRLNSIHHRRAGVHQHVVVGRADARGAGRDQQVRGSAAHSPRRSARRPWPPSAAG